METKELISELEATGDYKVVKKLYPQESYNEDDGSDKRIAIFLDVETTGLSVDEAEIIELGMIAFEFSIKDRRIFKIIDEFDEFEEPKKGEISQEITDLTGITNDMVKGKKINDEKVNKFISDAVIIIAHNANFDRQFVEKRFHVFKDIHWGCSLNDVSWTENGLKARNLEYLAYIYGYYFEAHRASYDCRASVHLLAQELPKSKELVLDNLLNTARKKTARIFAEKAPFDKKDQLKERSYKWNPDMKVWFIDVNENDMVDELTWLGENIYSDGRTDHLQPSIFGATKRYSDRIS
jgi:DNA polymerase-3 subunit epsilon